MKRFLSSTGQATQSRWSIFLSKKNWIKEGTEVTYLKTGNTRHSVLQIALQSVTPHSARTQQFILAMMTTGFPDSQITKKIILNLQMLNTNFKLPSNSVVYN